MNFRTFDLISNVSSFSVLLPLLFLILTIYKRKAPYTVKVLGAYLFIAGLSDLLSTILIELKINQNLVISIYVILQFIFFSLIYQSSFTQKVYKKITTAGIIVFLIFAAYNLIVIQGIEGFNSNSFTVSSIVFITYSILFFYRMIIELPVLQIQGFFMFWFNSAIFIYFGFNLFVFISIDRLLQSEGDQLLFSWTFHNCINVIRNIILALGLYTSQK